MVTYACVEPRDNRFVVKVDWGRTTETIGPYRWRWLARLVAWLEDGQH